VLAAGNIAIATVPGQLGLVMAASTVIAIGAALAYSALPLLVMAAVPPTQTAAANSLNTLMRMLGTSSCSAVVAAVTTGMTMQAAGRVLPSAGAYAVVFLAAAGAALLACAIAALTPHPGPADTPATMLGRAVPEAA
ncbi:MAG TPA: MFS transporter, partial [Pseudonocardia sp.]|nr:MFS transporter [Pseudonocardia sp.]